MEDEEVLSGEQELAQLQILFAMVLRETGEVFIPESRLVETDFDNMNLAVVPDEDGLTVSIKTDDELEALQ